MAGGLKKISALTSTSSVTSGCDVIPISQDLDTIPVTNGISPQDLLNESVHDYSRLTGQSGSPSIPASGDFALYFKTDGKLYKLDSSGSEIEVGGSGSTGDYYTKSELSTSGCANVAWGNVQGEPSTYPPSTHYESHSGSGSDPAVVPTITVSGSTKTLALTDLGTLQVTSASVATSITVPPNSSVTFPVGTTIAFCQGGSGALTITAGSGVTILYETGLVLNAQHAMASIIKVDTNIWRAGGRLKAS